MPPSRPDQRYPSGSGSHSTDGSSGDREGGSRNGASRKAKESGPLPFPEAYNEIKNLNSIPVWLAPIHFVAAIFMFLQGLFIFVFTARIDLEWCIYTFYPSADHSIYETDIYAVPDPKLKSCYTVSWLAGIVVCLSGIDHMFCVLPYFREKYEYYIERHQSPQRWIEYSFSCPLMRVLIAQIAGVTDIYTLILIFCLTQATPFFGLLHEKMNAKNRADGYRQDWTAFFMGGAAHCVSWAVVFVYFVEGMAEQDRSLALGLVVTLFVLELSFPIIFALQWCKVGIFEDFLVGEFSFCVLSFTTKTFLAWTTLIGSDAYTRRG